MKGITTIANYKFCTQIRVRYAETDKLGVAYNSHYLAWFEVGRTELLQNYGLTYKELERTGYHYNNRHDIKQQFQYTDIIKAESFLLIAESFKNRSL